jgi:hypothetical protein
VILLGTENHRYGSSIFFFYDLHSFSASTTQASSSL